MSGRIRPARTGDAAAIAEIHNQGVADRIATFRTESRLPAEVEQLVAGGALVLVAEYEGAVVGWAGLGPYDDPNPWYAGVAEATVYVDRSTRGSGVGRELLAALEGDAEAQGRYKLIAKIFDTNEPSLRLFERAGYITVGTHRRHGLLDGDWRDVVVLEKLIGPAAGD